MTTLNVADLRVEYSVQGISGEMALGAYPRETLEAMLVYGARRMLQDSVNSSAFAARKDGEDVTPAMAQAFVSARLGVFTDGTVGVRSASAPKRARLETIRDSILWDAIKAKQDRAGVKKMTKMEPRERTDLLERAFDGLSAEAQATLTARAQARLDAETAAKGLDLGDLGDI